MPRATSPTSSEIEYQINAYWASHPRLPSVIAFSTLARQRNASLSQSSLPSPERNPHEGHWAARQLGESVTEFLRRLPVQSISISDAGDCFLWIANPHAPSGPISDIAALKRDGSQLLNRYREWEDDIRGEMAGKSMAIVTRRLTPGRNSLRRDILTMAAENRVVVGKWMLFPTFDELPRAWRLVAEGTAAGTLGVDAKVAVNDGSERARLICIYTVDFRDLEDVKRVLEKLVELGLVDVKGRPIYYKCDAYTHLDIEGQNPYGLRNSLWSSKEVLEGTASLEPLNEDIKTQTTKKRKQATLDSMGVVGKKAKR